MPRKFLIAGSLLAILGLVVLVLSQALKIDAQNVNDQLLVPTLVRGGVDHTFPWKGQKYQKLELSLNAGKSWSDVAAAGSGDIKTSLPSKDSNEAQIRITLEDGRVIPSDLFTIDSSAPTSVIAGKPSIAKGRIRIPFNVIGPDVESVGLTLIDRNGMTAHAGNMSFEDAQRDGFPAPTDGVYAIILQARDRVGNVEAKTVPDATDFIVDQTAATLTLDLAYPAGRKGNGNFLLGGEKMGIGYTVADEHPDLASLRFEVIGKDASGAEQVLAQVDPGLELNRAGRFDWNVPYEDWGSARIRMLIADESGNVARISSETFAVFAGAPEAFIVRESPSTDDKLRFTIDYLHLEGFDTVKTPWRVHIYEGVWDKDQARFVWDMAGVHKDTEWVDDKTKTEIEISTQRQNRAYVARFVTGAGTNPLTETLPNQSTEPESIWIGIDRVRRIQLVDLPAEKRILQANRAVTLSYLVPSGSERNTKLMLEYSTDGGATWLPITPEPFLVNLSAVGPQDYVWQNPPQDIQYATVRAVTQFTSDVGILYRVQDVMEGGLIIDGHAPTASIVRVLDGEGRVLRSGDYTNSSELSVQWRASDRGSAGLSHLTLWDNVKTSSTVMGATQFTWNDRKFLSKSITPGSEERAINPVDERYTIDFGALARPIGKLGLILEAVDRAGNRRFAVGGPALVTPPEFELNVDLIRPKAKIVNVPSRASYRPGEVVTIAWEAWDNEPDPLVQRSMDANPVSIHVIYGRGPDNEPLRSTLATGLSAKGSTDIIVPALVDKEIRFLVTARDRAGNESLLNDEFAMTASAPVRNLKVPEAVLEPVKEVPNSNSLILSWQIVEGNASEISDITLWVRTSPQDPFKSVRVELPQNTITYALPSTDKDFEFAVTARSVHGLNEPVPSVAEQRYSHDIVAPEVSLEIYDPVTDRTVTSYIREDDHTAENFPRVRARVADLHFRVDNISVSLTRNGARGTDAFDASKIINGVLVDLGPVPVQRAEAITIVLAASDEKGNRTQVSRDLLVKDPPNWEFVGLVGAEPFYTRTKHYLFWKSHGEVSQNGTVDLSMQRVSFDAEAGRFVEQGPELPIVTGTSDEEGRYYLEAGLPDEAGEYQFILRTIDASGTERTATTRHPSTIVEPSPELDLNPGMNATERANPEGAAREYIFKGVATERITIEVRDEANRIGWYPLPPKAKDGLRLRYRFQGPKMDAPAPWKSKTFEVPSRPAAPGTQLELGAYGVLFTPEEGEGRYEVIPEFTDVFGHRAIWPNEPSTGIFLIFDAGAPLVKLETGLGKRSFFTEDDISRLFASAEDPLLVKDTVRLEYRLRSSEAWRAMPMKGEFAVENQTAKSISGFIDPDFQKAGRYEIRLVAEDELGQMGIAALDGPVYAGRANYVASHPLPSRHDDPLYTNDRFSRRPNFRVKVDPVNPWPDDVGLSQLTLWWRMEDPSAKVADEWHPIDFKDQWLIGQLEGEWNGDKAPGHEISLPFQAERSGKYQFVVTSQSMYDQLEDPETEPAYGKRRTIPRETEPEYEATVYVAGSAVEMHMPSEGPNMVAEQVVSLKQGRVQQLETYTISWTYTTSTENADNIDKIDFTMEFFDGQHWQYSQALTPAPLNDPKMGLMTFTTNLAENRVDMLGNRLKVYTYRAYWKCPPVVEDVDGFAARLRITAREFTKNSLPALSYEAISPRFRVGEPRPGHNEQYIEYYERKMEDGRAQMAEGKYWEAIRHFRDARLEDDTSEANNALADAYSKVGDLDRSTFHREHAARPGVVDHQR